MCVYNLKSDYFQRLKVNFLKIASKMPIKKQLFFKKSISLIEKKLKLSTKNYE